MDVVGRQLVLLRQLDDPGEQARWRLFAVHESREPVAGVGDLRFGPGGLWLRLFAGDPCRRRRFLGRDLGCDSRVSASLRRFLAKRGENQLVGASLSNDSLQSDSLWVTDLSRGGVTDLSPGGAPQSSPPPLTDPSPKESQIEESHLKEKHRQADSRHASPKTGEGSRRR